MPDTYIGIFCLHRYMGTSYKSSNFTLVPGRQGRQTCIRRESNCQGFVKVIGCCPAMDRDRLLPVAVVCASGMLLARDRGCKPEGLRLTRLTPTRRVKRGLMATASPLFAPFFFCLCFFLLLFFFSPECESCTLPAGPVIRQAISEPDLACSITLSWP